MTDAERSDRPGADLTARQRAILQFIEDTARERGYPPSVREIGEATGLASTSSVTRQLWILQQKGYLDRTAGRPRSVVIRPPGEADLIPGSGAGAHPGGPGDGTARVPLVWRIAAGGPVLTGEYIEDVFSLPTQLVGHGEFFMLRVAGESMINAGILDGDLVVVRRNTDVENGDIVAAVIEDMEAEGTVKTFRRAAGHVWLIPHNPDCDPIPGDRASIAGKVVAVLRRV